MCSPNPHSRESTEIKESRRGRVGPGAGKGGRGANPREQTYPEWATLSIEAEITLVIARLGWGKEVTFHL